MIWCYSAPCAFQIPGDLDLWPQAEDFNPRPGIRQIPVRAQQNGHGTGWRAAAIDQSLSPATGG